MAKGRFTGGSHTDQKVRTVQAYAGFFAQALRNQPFRRIYIDAFAGNGTYSLDHGDAGLLEGLIRDGVEVKPGSAEFAVAVDPPFDAIYFLEMERRSVEALTAIAERHPGRTIEVRPGDANVALKKLCAEIPWRRQGGARAVLFLDPFGMSVEWSTMEEIAATKAIDVWYLFPTGAVSRQLPYDHTAVDANFPTTTPRSTPTRKRHSTECSADRGGETPSTSRSSRLRRCSLLPIRPSLGNETPASTRSNRLSSNDFAACSPMSLRSPGN